MLKFIKNTLKVGAVVTIAYLIAFTKYDSLNAATVSGTVAQSAVSNLSLTLGTGAKITAFRLTSSSTTVGTAALYDTTNVGLTNVFGSYNTILSYATNCITTWTNYYGRTNNLTNICLVDVTNTVAATTNAILPLAVFTAGTNSTFSASSLSLLFQNGITISNATAPGSGTITYSVDYTQ